MVRTLCRVSGVSRIVTLQPDSLADSSCLDELFTDPPVDSRQALLQRNLGLPPQDLPQPRIVTVAATHALRLCRVVSLDHMLPRDLGDQVHESVHGDQPIRSQVERLAPIGLHQPVDTLDTIVHVTVRARLLAIPHTSISPPSGTRAIFRQSACGAFSRPPLYVPSGPYMF